MALIDLFRAFVEPTPEMLMTVHSEIQTSVHSSTERHSEEEYFSRHSLVSPVSDAYMISLAKKINLADILGAPQAALLAVDVNDNQFKSAVLKQIAGRWKPIKKKMSFSAIMAACQDPSPKNILPALQECVHNRNKDLVLCVYAALFMATRNRERIQLNPEDQVRAISIHAEIFDTGYATLTTDVLNAYCGMIQADCNGCAPAFKSISHNRYLYQLPSLKYCTDNQLCWYIDGIATNKRMNLSNELKGMLSKDPQTGLFANPSFTGFLASRPAVAAHLENMASVSAVMQS